MWSLLHNPSAYPICMNTYFFRGRFVLHLQTGNVNRSAISSGAFAVFPLEIHWIQSWNTPPCLWNSKLRYPPTSSEFQSKKPPLSLGIPRCRPWYGMDIFWNHPLVYMNNYSKTHLYKYMTCTTETQFIQSPKGHAKISELSWCLYRAGIQR